VQILELVRESVYPRVIFESLLDQIERLQSENRRLLYGDGDGGMTIDGVDGLSINEDGAFLFTFMWACAYLCVSSGSGRRFHRQRPGGRLL
jgi:hypothetical protein